MTDLSTAVACLASAIARVERARETELLIRCLRAETENRVLHEALRRYRYVRADEPRTTLIIKLRDEERLYWREIGARVGLSTNATRVRYVKAKEQAIRIASHDGSS